MCTPMQEVHTDLISFKQILLELFLITVKRSAVQERLEIIQWHHRKLLWRSQSGADILGCGTPTRTMHRTQEICQELYLRPRNREQQLRAPRVWRTAFHDWICWKTASKTNKHTEIKDMCEMLSINQDPSRIHYTPVLCDVKMDCFLEPH